MFTGVNIFEGPEYPTGVSVEPPASHDRVSDGVLLIVLDGLPAYVMDNPELMPTLANWTDFGAKANVSTSEITLTGPCTKEMSTGISASPIDAMRNWEIQYEGKDDAFHYALEENMSVAFTGFYVWSNLFTDNRFNHQTIYDSGFSDVYDADDKIISNVNKWLIGQTHDLMVAHLGGTDHAGHIYGTNSDEYKEKMLHLDNQLNQIKNSLPEDWTLMITADHGMSESGGHAISTGDTAMNVNLLLYGSGIKSGATQDIAQKDIASLPLVLLDLPFPISADSRIPLNLLDLGSSEEDVIEQWNWDAQVLRQQWLEENGYPYAEVDSSDIEWDSLPSRTQSPNALDIISSLVPLIIIFLLALHVSKGRTFFTSNTIPVVALCLGYTSMVWSHYIWFYDSDFSIWTGAWLRKSVGILSVIGITSVILWHVFSQKQSESKLLNLPWWSPYLAMGAILWSPDSRLSPTIAILGIILVIYFLKNKKPESDRLSRIVFMSIILISAWTMYDYGASKILGISIYIVTDIGFFYKFWQQVVTQFMTQNYISAIILTLICTFIADRIYFKENNSKWLLLALPLIWVIVMHSIGNSWLDRIIICGLIYCLTQMVLNRTNHPKRIKSPFRAKWSELFALGLIIPTWGCWPAMVTLLLIRSISIIVDEHLTWLKNELPNPFSESCRQVVLALIPWTLLCIVWTNYSLMTPTGLIEFNPTKIIVTGGFFGARTNPPILWMAIMVAAPLFISCTMVVNAWKKAGFSLFPSLLMISFMFTTNMSNMWLTIIRPQVLLMAGFSSIVFLFWIGCLLAGENTMSTLLKGDGEDIPKHSDLNK